MRAKSGKLPSMKTARFRNLGGAAVVALALSVGALAQPASWLNLLNAENGRTVKLSEKDVVFAPGPDSAVGAPVAVGYRQSDGTLTLGSLIWSGKVWSPLGGYAEILQQRGFAEADDETRTSVFLDLLRTTNEPLGTWVYTGPAGKSEDRPGPPVGYRQTDGLHRFVVWYCEEPGTREGPEWRRVLYIVDANKPSVQARTLASFHPVPEGLKNFPAIPSAASE